MHHTFYYEVEVFDCRSILETSSWALSNPKCNFCKAWDTGLSLSIPSLALFRVLFIDSRVKKCNNYTTMQEIYILPDKKKPSSVSHSMNLTDASFEFDICYTSVLKRAIRTLWLVLDRIDQMWVPVHRTWRLNERHYGGLTGLNKAETAAKHGEAQVKVWRRSFDIPPPPMGPDHDYYTIISKVRYHIGSAWTQSMNFADVREKQWFCTYWLS